MKRKPFKNKKLRDSARDQNCTMAVAGVCKNRTETTVLAHVNTEGGSMGGKTDDYSACFCCFECHQWLDLMKGSEEDRLYYTRRAVKRTIDKWIDMGLAKFG